MKPDQERVKNLLNDTVTLLCKNGLLFSKELRIEGLLGVTVDNKDCFFVHISEKFGTGTESSDIDSEDSISTKKLKKKPNPSASPHRKDFNSTKSIPSRSFSHSSPHASSPSNSHSTTPVPNVKIKTEKDDDLIMIDSKPSCMLTPGNKRVPPTHGGPGPVFPGLKLSNQSPSNFGQFHMAGESPAKRQAVGDGGAGGAFITSMVRNVHEQNSQNTSTWQDLAAQVGGAGAVEGPSLDSIITGNSPWPSPGGAQLAMQSGSDMVGICTMIIVFM